jgi:hypothetical protein
MASGREIKALLAELMPDPPWADHPAGLRASLLLDERY